MMTASLSSSDITSKFLLTQRSLVAKIITWDMTSYNNTNHNPNVGVPEGRGLIRKWAANQRNEALWLAGGWLIKLLLTQHIFGWIIHDSCVDCTKWTNVSQQLPSNFRIQNRPNYTTPPTVPSWTHWLQNLGSHTAARVWVVSQKDWRNQAATGRNLVTH